MSAAQLWEPPGEAATLYILWALTAFPLHLYVKQNSIVYMNQAINNTAMALLYLVTCGALFFSEIRMMVVFGATNVVILLIVMAVKRYAFTSYGVPMRRLRA